jgi:UDP-N-acetylglucosamine 2-epimerase (non-hydrolysing)
MSPLIQELQTRAHPFVVIHTGQHFSYSMDRRFFRDLELPDAEFHLRASRKGSLHGEQTAHMLRGTERALIAARPRIVLVCGDANTNLAAALAARKLRLMLGHVESGLRSFDWSMPEEHNRVMIDHIADLLFAPTEEARAHLEAERVRGAITVTGNTVVDALRRSQQIAMKRSRVLDKLGVQQDGYVVLTVHREENVDDAANLAKIANAIHALRDETGMPVLFPVHPRTMDRLAATHLLDRLTSDTRIRLPPPKGYLDFLMLLSNARLVATDSGGIQEESCTLRIPCVTLRENTERPETVKVGANIVAGLDRDAVRQAVRSMLQRPRDWANPYGDGTASQKIIDIVLEHL